MRLREELGEAAGERRVEARPIIMIISIILIIIISSSSSNH